MKRIPNAREVNRALKGTVAATKRVLKGVNALAAQVMEKGNYQEAELLVAKGKEIRAFQGELVDTMKRWAEICSGRGRRRERHHRTPLWSYYQPVLRALVELGGQGSRDELEPIVERLMVADLQKGDQDSMSRGRPRWTVMIQRSRKHLASERWIEDDRSKVWKITAAGRKAAEAGAPTKG